MAFFWLQTTITNKSGDMVKMLIDAPYETVKDITSALAKERVIACDKVWTVPDGAGRKIITSREEIGIGVGYVGMVQTCETEPVDPEA